MTPAWSPLVIQVFVPFRTYLSPFFSAKQRSAAASEPASASLSA
jgi:hypothetical protein